MDASNSGDSGRTAAAMRGAGWKHAEGRRENFEFDTRTPKAATPRVGSKNRGWSLSAMDAEIIKIGAASTAQLMADRRGETFESAVVICDANAINAALAAAPWAANAWCIDVDPNNRLEPQDWDGNSTASTIWAIMCNDSPVYQQFNWAEELAACRPYEEYDDEAGVCEYVMCDVDVRYLSATVSELIVDIADTIYSPSEGEPQCGGTLVLRSFDFQELTPIDITRILAESGIQNARVRQLSSADRFDIGHSQKTLAISFRK